MAYKKLKDFVADVPNEDGSSKRRLRYHKSETITIHIETTGELRMFIMVPPFMAGVCDGWTYPANYNIKVETMTDKRGGEKFKALVGRDPSALSSAWKSLVDHFKNEMDALTLEPVIKIVAGEHRRGFNSYGSDQSAMVSFEFTRFLRNTKDDEGGKIPVHDYEWNDEHKPLKKIGRYGARDRREKGVVPYTPELWASLENMRDQINAAQKVLEGLVDKGQLAERLLSGKSPLALSGPQQ